MKQRFVDLVSIRVRAGDGGDGAVHFRREKYVPRGGPDGGDGGDGGSVFLVGDTRKRDLLSLTYERQFIAGHGGRGKAKKMRGAKGKSVFIRVPLGTVVVDEVSGDVLGEILREGQRLLVARGGKGGRGNARFATPVDRAPTRAEKGAEGQERFLRLEMRLLGEVGMVGLPNAGKSTLLCSMTNAKARVGAWPFTTKRPNLGTVRMGEIEGSFVVVDIPGILRGAARGKGMGTHFLRHIQRCRILLLVLDPTQGEVEEQARALLAEMEEHDPALLEKDILIAINKADLAPGPFPPRIAGKKALSVSALTGQGIEHLLDELAGRVRT